MGPDTTVDNLKVVTEVLAWLIKVNKFLTLLARSMRTKNQPMRILALPVHGKVQLWSRDGSGFVVWPGKLQGSLPIHGNH